MNFKNKETDELVQAFLMVKTEEECYKLLEDLCTVKEILEMGQRLHVAKMLANKDSYQQIAEETGASTATISRINKCYMYSDGYKLILDRLNKKK